MTEHTAGRGNGLDQMMEGAAAASRAGLDSPIAADQADGTETSADQGSAAEQWLRTRLFMRRPWLDDLPAAPSLPDGFAQRTYRPGDEAALAALLTRAFAETENWDAQTLGERLTAAPDVPAIFLLTDGSDRPVATASARLMEIYPGSGYLHWVGVDPAYQGKGLGAHISLCVLRYFKDRGLRDAVLETHDYRLAAVRTYLRLGFVPESRDDAEQRRWARVLPRLLGATS